MNNNNNKEEESKETKVQAVLHSYTLWAWLEQSDSEEKREYPLYHMTKIDGIYRSSENQKSYLPVYESDCCCPLCAYQYNKRKSYNKIMTLECQFCPMRGRWPSIPNENIKELSETCMYYPSAYDEWENPISGQTVEERKILAGEIAKALWKLYKELEAK